VCRERTNQIDTAKSNVQALQLFFDSLGDAEWRSINMQKSAGGNTIDKARRFHSYALHGMLRRSAIEMV
jgi:hypothetical protein